MNKIFCLILWALFANHSPAFADGQKPRLTLFVGVDISGSFQKSAYYEDSLDFLARYLYAHLNGLGGLEVPQNLFVGSIGGSKADEAKTLYPIQIFEDKSVEEISAKLRELFPKNRSNPFTDFNAFFEQVEATVRNKNLILRPINIVLVTDGVPDVTGKRNFKKINVRPLENLARSITLRLLYTDAVTGREWQEKVKRQRVKIWTQDAPVMVSWKDPKIYLSQESIKQQEKFFAWVKDNVDFGVRSRRVD